MASPKRIRYDDYLSQNKDRMWAARMETLRRYPAGQRPVSRKPRDPDEERILIQMDLQRRERMIQSGELEQLGPRRWRWN